MTGRVGKNEIVMRTSAQEGKGCCACLGTIEGGSAGAIDPQWKCRSNDSMVEVSEQSLHRRRFSECVCGGRGGREGLDRIQGLAMALLVQFPLSLLIRCFCIEAMN